MNEQQLTQLINESIRLESNVADLYMTFCKTFREDYGFWYQLHMEEKNHAFIIQGAREAWSSGKQFPLEILSPNVDELIALNTKLAFLLEEYDQNTKLVAYSHIHISLHRRPAILCTFPLARLVENYYSLGAFGLRRFGN